MIDWLIDWSFLTARQPVELISCLEVRELHLLYVHIYISYVVIP